MASTSTTTLPLREAAARLGVDPDNLRKRVRRGTYPGWKRDGVWMVDVPAGGQDDGQASGQDVQASGPDTGQASGQATSLLAQRAEEMARYTATLLAPLHAQLAAQAEEIGALKTQLAAVTQSAPPAEGQTGRSWWQRLFG